MRANNQGASDKPTSLIGKYCCLPLSVLRVSYILISPECILHLLQPCMTLLSILSAMLDKHPPF
eukprot:scaffold9214_cov125-Skeletonema_dohrnii-CCMP3373.AAC.7